MASPVEAARRLVALLALVSLSAAARAEQTSSPDALLAAGLATRQGVVRVQWRPPAGLGPVVERHAIVVGEDGWLLMAGPLVGDSGTLAATFADGRSARARTWAADARSGLTLLRVALPGLSALVLGSLPAREVASAPPRLPAGTPIAMVTAEGALARGALRASHRTFRLDAPGRRGPYDVTGLDEAALAVVSTDLGAPWVDAQGQVVGLLLGAEVDVPDRARPPEEGFSLRPEVVAAYAVPGPVLATVWPLLRDRRGVDRAALGIRARALDAPLAEHVCPDCAGWVVVEILSGGPAERAGLAVGDIVRAIDRSPLAPRARLADALLPHRPGDRVALAVLRRGDEVVLDVQLGAAP